MLLMTPDDDDDVSDDAIDAPNILLGIDYGNFYFIRTLYTVSVIAWWTVFWTF